ncbi:glycine betaine ABC transporter substrate-binding protein [Ekhidna sp. To15]|uniref:glycine betaine ABC transporter substrate-binding protein n=1 Tax=Ekhidna sp. To15 TaxID=3395267 RepID=UPI003F51B6D3
MSLWEFIISHWNEVVDQTVQHLKLTIVSMLIASVIGILIGILITRIEKIASVTLGFVGVIQTIPSLALLGFLLPIVGIGTTPAIIALFLYALLPIVRNTYTGIKGIEPSIKEASVGMGMTQAQLMRFVELPLAFPIILAGIRTSAVINVGVATLCALIAAGGLGEFIFRGISLNNTNMILAGAIPASLLALALDALLGLIQRFYKQKSLWVSIIGLGFVFLVLSFFTPKTDSSQLVAGFNSEFIERADGFVGLDSVYDLPMEVKEMEIALMYRALYEEDVDVIDGFSTDGRIKEFNLKLLNDDKRYFPPYHAVPLINGITLSRYPDLIKCFNEITGAMSDSLMATLNYEVDGKKRALNLVANDYLKTINIYANPNAGSSDSPDIIIGSKAFTENFLLAHIFAQLIENKTKLKTKLQLGFGGTKLVFDALRLGEIDIYPEYTGTAYLVLLKKKPSDISNFNDPQMLLDTITAELEDLHNIQVLSPLGFNNTFALMMRRDHADSLEISTISELSDYLRKE